MKKIEQLYKSYILNEEKILSASLKIYSLFLKSLPYLIMLFVAIGIAAYGYMKITTSIEKVKIQVSEYTSSTAKLFNTIVNDSYYKDKRNYETKLYYGLYSDSVKFNPKSTIGVKDGTKVKVKKT